MVAMVAVIVVVVVVEAVMVAVVMGVVMVVVVVAMVVVVEAVVVVVEAGPTREGTVTPEPEPQKNPGSRPSPPGLIFDRIFTLWQLVVLKVGGVRFLQKVNLCMRHLLTKP